MKKGEKMTKPNHSIEEVKASVLKFKESGLKVAEYCRQNNLNPNQLRWFIRRLENHEYKKQEPINPGFTQIPVLINTGKSIIKIRCRDFEIEIQDDVNQKTLQKVIIAIETSHV